MIKKTATAALVWTAILGTSAIFGSYFLACVFPFAAIATIAALTLNVRRGVALVVATWFANQVVGFALMHYPQTLDTAALGVSLGLGALAAYIVAHVVLRRGSSVVRTVAALGAAFIAYQLVIYAGALGFGGADNFSPAIIAGVALNDAIWFAGLATLNLVLTRAVPTLFNTRVARSA
jgi:hypothetical protein